MFRRVSRNVAGLSANKFAAPTTVAKRHMEPMSSWWLFSWAMLVEYSLIFWFPLVMMDIIIPGFMYNKFPLLHFFDEKRSEAKLRRVLDETYTAWADDVDASTIEDAISRATI